MKKQFWLIIKIVLSFLGLYYVITRVDLADVTAQLSIISLVWLIPAFLLYVFSKYITAIRYSYLLKSYGCELSFWDNLKLYLCGMYYNLILPGGVSGDFYKAYIINKKYALSLKELAVVSIKDRVYGAFAIVMLLGVLLCFSKIYERFSVLIIALVIAAYILYYLLIIRFFSKLSSGFHQAMVLSLIGQLAQIVSFIFLLKTMKAETQLMEYTGVFLISSLIASLPVTIGGMGAREVTFYYFSGVLFLDVNVAIVSSVLFYLITVLTSLLGLPYSLAMKETLVDTKVVR